MDEIDVICEVSLFGQMCYWVEENEFEILVETIRDSKDKQNLVLEFITISGMEVILPFTSISDLNKSTKAQRVMARQINKEYQESEVNRKEEWQ